MLGLCHFVKRGRRNLLSCRYQMPIEALEARLLLSGDVLINSTAYDSVAGTTADYSYAGQQAATNIAYDPAGSDTPAIVAGYQNSVMHQFVHGTSPYRAYADSTSISTDGGSSFNTLFPDTPLPDGPGSSYYGDGGNAILARDPTTGNIFLATTSDTGGNIHPDIQVFESTNGGQSFSAPMNATPGFSTSAQLDKPWIAFDSSGKLWLTFVNLSQDGSRNPGIYLTSYSGTSWPYVGSGDTLIVDATSGDVVHGPQVVMDTSSNPNVPYVIYYEFSSGVASINAVWNGGSKVLATLNPSTFDQDYPPDMYVSTGDGTPIRAEYFPSAAYDLATNEMYVAYSDRDTSGVPHADVLAWNLTGDTVNTQQVYISGDSLNAGEAWNPSIAISSDGGSLFVGFYGLPNSNNDDVYVYGATGSISTSGSATLNDADPLSSSYFLPANTPDSKLSFPTAYYWGDNDSVSADYDNFYYSHLKTTSKTFNVGGTPTTYVESDVYLATVSIPYSSRLAKPARPAFTDTGGATELTWSNGSDYNSVTPTPGMYAEYSTATQPWTVIPWSEFYSAPAAFQGYGHISSSFDYDPTQTYYFRIRAGYFGSNSTYGSSTYSDVLVVPGSNAMVFNGTTGDDTILLTEDSDGEHIDYTLNGVAQTPVSIISGGSLLVLGDGGTDSIEFDFSNGNFLTGTNVVDDGGGTASLTIIGSTGTDTVSLGSPAAPIVYDGDTIAANNTELSDLAFNDDGGTDTINCESIIPMDIYMSGSDTINNNGGTVTLHFE